MAFVTYENRRNPHITIHVAGCSQIEKRGGEHKHGQGQYNEHATLVDAQDYAQQTGLRVIECSFCKPHRQQKSKYEWDAEPGVSDSLAPLPEAIMEQNSSIVYLVSCVRKKQEQACPARDLYVSPWFLRARCYAEASGCRWFILSAEYGLVPPDRESVPYNRTLNQMMIADRRSWAERVFGQLVEAMPELTHVVFLAGKRYRQFLTQHLADRGTAMSVPMEGLRIGEQLGWLGMHSPRL